MEELFKNSLLGQLQDLGLAQGTQTGAMQGIISSIKTGTEENFTDGPNPLAIKVNGDIKDSPFVDNPIKKEEASAPKANIQKEPEVSKDFKRRLNDFDFDILQDSAIKKASDEFSGGNVFGKFLYKYFPKIYKSFLIKKALNKLNSLNKTTLELMSKKIPYGESDERYNALIEYLSSANTIHAKLLKKI